MYLYDDTVMSLFITFEGMEGSGKSTQARLLYERLQARGYPVILTREPGGTRIGELIRRILVDLQHTEMAPTTETLLFAAARAQLVSELIRPYLETGGIVLCDRYADSTYAYQGYGLGRDLQELAAIIKIATSGLTPDLTIYLDLTPEEGLERKRRAKMEHRSMRGSIQPNGEEAILPETTVPVTAEWNRLDARDIAYHQRVSEGFQDLIRQEPERWRLLDARLSINALVLKVEELVEPYLERVTPLESD